MGSENSGLRRTIRLAVAAVVGGWAFYLFLDLGLTLRSAYDILPPSKIVLNFGMLAGQLLTVAAALRLAYGGTGVMPTLRIVCAYYLALAMYASDVGFVAAVMPAMLGLLCARALPVAQSRLAE